jgi:hypothetical protein
VARMGPYVNGLRVAGFTPACEKSPAVSVAVLSWEVGVVERRSEEQGVEAASSATQLAVRQSVVPLLRQPHPPRPRPELCLLGRIAPYATVTAERRVQAAMLRLGVCCAVLARSVRSVR